MVSDPPYGVRAGARCAGKDGAVKPVPDGPASDTKP